MRLAISLTLILLAALAGRPDATPVPRAKKSTEFYFPTAVGTKKAYAVVSGGNPGRDATSVVTRAVEKDGAWRVTTEENSGHAVRGIESVYAVSADGLAVVARNGDDLPTPHPLLKLPAAAGHTWSFEDVDLRVVVRTYTVGKATEVVETPAGKFTAVPVTCVYAVGEASTVTETAWYAVGVGRVKMVSKSNTSE